MMPNLKAAEPQPAYLELSCDASQPTARMARARTGGAEAGPGGGVGHCPLPKKLHLGTEPDLGIADLSQYALEADESVVLTNEHANSSWSGMQEGKVQKRKPFVCLTSPDSNGGKPANPYFNEVRTDFMAL